MSTFPQSSDDRAMFVELLQRHFDDWSLPQNNPRKWYMDDASTFDLVTPLEGYRTPDDYIPGANKGFFNKASRAVFTVKEVLRISRLSDDVVLTEILFHGSAQFKNGGEPMEMDGRQTQVWVRRDGKWFVFHEHNSGLLNQSRIKLKEGKNDISGSEVTSELTTSAYPRILSSNECGGVV